MKPSGKIVKVTQDGMVGVWMAEFSDGHVVAAPRGIHPSMLLGLTWEEAVKICCDTDKNGSAAVAKP